MKFSEYRDMVLELKGLDDLIQQKELIIQSVTAKSAGSEGSGGKKLETCDRVIVLADLKESRDELIMAIEEETGKMEMRIRHLEKPRQRTIVRLRYLEGLTFEEIAKEVVWSLPTVKKEFYKAARILKI